jgi:hypothetical protein
MLKNITLSADDHLIQKARKKAKSENSTLNSLFRLWLEKYTNLGSNSNEYEALMEKLSYAKPTRHYTREEMNER